MRKTLTEAERKGALEAYAICGNYRQVAREFAVSEGAIRKLVRTRAPALSRAADAGTPHRLTEVRGAYEAYEAERAARTASILEHLEARRELACGIIDLALAALSDPEKYRRASLKTIADTMAVVIDRFLPTVKAEERPGLIDAVARELFQRGGATGADEREDDGAPDGGAASIPEADAAAD